MNSDIRQVDILLVEDNANDAELTLDALRESGLVNKVHWAKDGAEALEFLFGRGPDQPCSALRLVLLDLRLPRVDGAEVLRRLRAAEETRSMPVVVLTSSNEEIDVVRAYELGVNSYIVKPVGSEAFFKAVTELGLYWMLLNRAPGEKR